MQVYDLKLMRLIGNAQDAAKAGDRERALLLAEQYAFETSKLFDSSPPQNIATMSGPLVQLYVFLKEWELATLKSQDLCALAELYCPNTAETAGDYTNLATALEHTGDYSNALAALEKAIEHIKGAGAWEKYSGYYERRSKELQQKAKIER